MHLRTKLAAITSAILLTGGIVVAVTTTAEANTTPLICNGASPQRCMNRQGGGILDGTHIITWNRDFDNNEDFSSVVIDDGCGASVHNGEGGMVCPFTNGSGLNARYDGRPIVQLQRRGTGFCIVPDGPVTGAVLGGCTDNGRAYVVSAANYAIDVYASNRAYANGFGTNRPMFLNGFDFNSEQLTYSFTGNAGIDQWYVSS